MILEFCGQQVNDAAYMFINDLKKNKNMASDMKQQQVDSLESDIKQLKDELEAVKNREMDLIGTYEKERTDFRS